jgi:hypothetical protein
VLGDKLEDVIAAVPDRVLEEFDLALFSGHLEVLGIEIGVVGRRTQPCERDAVSVTRTNGSNANSHRGLTIQPVATVSTLTGGSHC